MIAEAAGQNQPARAEEARAVGRPRPTIGFLTGNVHVGAARVLWPGVLEAAARADVDLICFPGGRLQAPHDFEAQRNVIYDLIDPQRLDGLVSWATTLAGTLGPDQVMDYHRRFRSLPMVSLGSVLRDEPTISIDSYQGMRAALSHLIDVHGYRRLALIRGPEGHQYAQERYQAFMDALRDRGIAVDDRLVSPPVDWENGAAAMATLLDEGKLRPGKDVEAVVAASDFLALGAMQTLADRGIRVPEDVAVAGFNALPESQLTRPPLTTVALPFHEQGRRAVATLVALLAGKTVPSRVVLESQLLVRRSCGCPSRSLSLATVRPEAGDERPSRLDEQALRDRMARLLSPAVGDLSQAATWANQLMDAFQRDLWQGPSGSFLPALDGMLQQRTPDGDETVAWHGAISLLRRWSVPALDQEKQLYAEDLFGQARLMIGEAAQRTQVARQLRTQRQAETLREIGQALITTFDVDRLAAVLIDKLPQLGIASCYLALYEDPTTPSQWARLVLAFRARERLALEPQGRRFPSQQLVPDDLRPDRRHSLLVAPLFFQAEQIGFVVFEIGPQDGSVYEVLRGHISSALKGALLLGEAYQARLAAEKADQIKTRLLANVSHELRTPLNIIIGHTQRALNTPSSSAAALSAELSQELRHIRNSAEHQLRIINDLLDLSRAEINELDLYPSLLDPRPLLEDAFVALAEDDRTTGTVRWCLQLPERLPLIEADPVRLRQVLLNLLNNARRFTERGCITLGAATERTELHLWIADTGAGIPPHQREHVFEPFVTGELVDQQHGGIGLGLSITRHLVALHGGRMALDSEPGVGSTFHVYLPLPDAEADPETRYGPVQPALWLISTARVPAPAVVAFCQQRDLDVIELQPATDVDALLEQGIPSAVAWDMDESSLQRWSLIRRIYNHPALKETPFILYHREAAGESAQGLTSLVVKPVSSDALWQAIRPTMPQTNQGSVLIVDDDPQARALGRAAVNRGLPGFRVREAEDGAAALAAMDSDPPDLVLLDLMMPGADGFEVLDQMRAQEHTRGIPVVILSSRQLTLDDVKRLERHAMVTVQSKGVLTEEEMIASLNRALFGSDSLPPQTSALAKEAIAYLHQNYARRLARWEIASAIGVSEDYLSRVFHRELGISPWEYLNRYRIIQAKEMLRLTQDPIGSIAQRVGFSDAAYFSRVFRNVSGMSPSAYRANLEG